MYHNITRDLYTREWESGYKCIFWERDAIKSYFDFIRSILILSESIIIYTNSRGCIIICVARVSIRIVYARCFWYFNCINVLLMKKTWFAARLDIINCLPVYLNSFYINPCVFSNLSCNRHRNHAFFRYAASWCKYNYLWEISQIHMRFYVYTSHENCSPIFIVISRRIFTRSSAITTKKSWYQRDKALRIYYFCVSINNFPCLNDVLET